MPRVYIQLLTKSDPDLEDVAGSSATIRFPEPMRELRTIDDLLTYLAAVPNSTHNLIRAIRVLLQDPQKDQNTPENFIPPEV